METDPTTGQTLGPDHPLTLGRCYYIVPAKLLEPALSAMGRDHLDQNIVELDRTLAGTMEAVPTLVGLWDRRPIHHELLNVRPPPSSDAFDQATLRWLGWESVTTVDKVRLALAEADDSLDRLRRSRRAYCGWLVCNRQFVLEQSALWREWQGQLRQYGIPVMGPAVADPASGIDAQKAQAPLGPLLQAFEAFLRRWELAQLSGPRLPVPFSPQWPALGPQSQPGHADSAVQQFSVPRTIPLIPADQMQQVLEDAIARPSAGSHLQDWMSIVAKDNSAKQTIGRYARLFQLQHYWRVLHSRYGPACTRRDGKLKSVFAEFLGVTDETVHVDLQLLRRRLGADWCRQGQP